jgi:hypothetical protein
MAEPEDTTTTRPDVPPDARPRRQPPIIEGEAVEVSIDGRSAPRAPRRLRRRMSAILPSRRLAAIVVACLAVAVAGSLWLYLAPDGSKTWRIPIMAGTPPARDAVTRRGADIIQVVQASPEKVSDKSPDSQDLETRIAAINGALASLSERIGGMEQTVRDAATAARAAAERADRLGRQFEEARKNGDEQDAVAQIDRGALDDLAGRIKALESRQMTVRQIQERLDRLAIAAGAPDKTVRLAVAAAALRSAVERDQPFAAELAAARSIGVDDSALAALEPFAATGLPRRNEMFRDLSALLPELRRVSAPPGQDLGYLDRLQASAVRMLNIRPVKDEPGDDPRAVLSRIEYKMIQQDVDAIVAELGKLPAPGKQLAQAWRTKAVARRDAVEAVRLLAVATLEKLGQPATSGTAPQ